MISSLNWSHLGFTGLGSDAMYRKRRVTCGYLMPLATVTYTFYSTYRNSLGAHLVDNRHSRIAEPEEPVSFLIENLPRLA